MTHEHLAQLVVDLPAELQAQPAVAELDRAGAVRRQRTYAELGRRCLVMASALDSALDPEAGVVLLGLEGTAFVEAFFGCLLAGRTAVPLRAPRHPRDAAALELLRGVVAQLHAPAIVCEPPVLATLREAGTLLAGLETCGARAFACDDLATDRHEGWRPRSLDGNGIAYLQFTSGSTFRPHGVALSHRNVLANLAIMQRIFAHRETLRGAGWLPLHHDLGLVGHVLLPLYERGSTLLLSPTTFLRDPAVWLRAFRQHGANGCAVPNFALDLCVQRRAFDDTSLDLSGWRYAYVGSEPVHAETLARFTAAFQPRGFSAETFRPGYGLAEATLFVAGGRPCVPRIPPGPGGRAPRPVFGYRIHPEHVDVRIVDPVTGAPVPDPQPGEIWVAGESVASSPAHDQGDASASLPGDARRWLRTGDMGFIDHGELFVSGRLKHVMVIRGAKFAAEDLEHTAHTSHPALRPTDLGACFAVERNHAEAVVAVQEIDRHSGAAVREDVLTAIRHALQEAHGVSPAAVVLVPAGTLPRTANGKISRWQCRSAFQEDRLESVAAWNDAPASRDPAGPDDDPVVIVGLACRFPGGADGPEAFWRLLREGRDAITEVPPDRWAREAFYDPRPAVPGKINTRWGGFIEGIGDFDPAFFGISAKEAAEIDPQQRLLLETAWRLFEQAGIPPERLAGSDTGVFVGISTNDYLYNKIKLGGLETFNAYTGLGNANSVAANRLSFLFDLHGPSVAVDTACSSSLTALHFAAESVRRGECSAAIAGGSNALLSPGSTITLSQFGMMAPDGRCKTFDASANGYVRAEGCGLVLLQRQSASRREGRRILAVIRASGIGQDGRSAGITSPNGAAQRELMRRVVRQAGIAPDCVGYVEAHGTGTAVGDPVEVEQIGSVYGAPAAGAPCYVGSAKASIGHLESAAGVASVIKTVLTLRRGEIPPQIHLRRLNPGITLGGTRLAITDRPLPWPRRDRPRVAAISSFGFGGANAHLVLEEGESEEASTAPHPLRAQLFTLSARTDSALRLAARDWVRWLDSHPDVPLESCCAVQATGRTHFAHRAAWVVPTRSALRDALASLASGPTAAARAANAAPPVCVLRDGPVMPSAAADALSACFPAFAQAMTRAAAAGVARSPKTARFSAQYALLRLWLSWLAQPVAFAGEGFGNLAAACGAGSVEPEEALAWLVARDAARHPHADGRPAADGGTARLLLEADESPALRQRAPRLRWVSLPGHDAASPDPWPCAPEAMASLDEAFPGDTHGRVEIDEAHDDTALLQTLGRLYVVGAKIRWENVFDRRPVEAEFPGHPFVRQRYWFEIAGDGAKTSAAAQPVAQPAVPSPQPAAKPAAAQPRTYGITWAPKPFAATSAFALPPAAAGTHWIVVGNGAGAARSVCERLRAASAPVYWLSRDSSRTGNRPTRLGGTGGLQVYAVPAATSTAGYADTLRQILNFDGIGGTRAWRVLYLGGIDATPTAQTTVETLERDQRLHGVGDALALVQAIIATGRILPLWIVTRHAQWIDAENHRDDPASVGVAQAPLWGFGRTLFLEHPELRGGLVDCDHVHPETIIRQVLEPEGEHSVGFRGGDRYIPQLVARSVPPGSVALQARGAYVVTGGSGGLGLRTARWLARRGARDIVLLSRRGAPTDAGAAEFNAASEEIRRLGGQVETVAADVRDVAALRGLWARLAAANRPVRGVVHAAGVNWFGKIREMAVDELLDSVRIKVATAWALHELTRHQPTDCFLLFSSVSALWGSVDLAHYTASNHFLDVLSCHRRGSGLPATSLDWGPWAEVGMSAKSREAELLDRLGLRLMAPDAAIETMERCIADGASAVVIADLEWSRFRRFAEFSLSPSLFAAIAPPDSAADPAAVAVVAVAESASGGLPAFKTMTEARTWFEATVRRALGAVMLVENAEQIHVDQRFNILGMDSLMAIAFAAELERVLNLRLPNTLAYNYPTIGGVVERLITLLTESGRLSLTPVTVTVPTEPAAVVVTPVDTAPATAAPPRWYVVPGERTRAPRRLYCFPCAGAGASAYHGWVQAFAAHTQVVSAQYPGREDRAAEPPLRSLAALVAGLADHWPADDERPASFFGHSVGALVAFELARELCRRGHPGPRHLFVSGCGVPEPGELRDLHTVTDDGEFIARLSAHLGGRPLSSGQRDIAHALVPLLRADIEMLETHRIAPEPPLDCPITVFAGEQDSLTPRAQVMRWHALTQGDFALRRFPGGHDFVASDSQRVLQTLEILLP